MNIIYKDKEYFWKILLPYIDVSCKTIILDSEKSVAYIYDKKDAKFMNLIENKSDEIDSFNTENISDEQAKRYYAKICIENSGKIFLDIKRYNYCFNFPKKDDEEEFDKVIKNIFFIFNFYEFPEFRVDELSSKLCCKALSFFDGESDGTSVAEEICDASVMSEEPLFYYKNGEYIIKPGACFDGEADEIFIKLSRMFGWDKCRVAGADKTSGLLITNIGYVISECYFESRCSVWFIEHTNFNDDYWGRQSSKKKINFIYSGLGVYHKVLTFVSEGDIEKLDSRHSHIRMIFAKRKDGKYCFQGLFFLWSVSQNKENNFVINYMRFEGWDCIELSPYPHSKMIK